MEMMAMLELAVDECLHGDFAKGYKDMKQQQKLIEAE
jgi:hypothetical protein